ncbi:hypothetical protein J6590_063052 [Homalodisca vitripennis]|nr:hypothetical protein J6590_063052 [Homalodisca vitripennis]
MSSIGVSREVVRRVLNIGVKELCEQMLKRKKTLWCVRSWILRRSDLGGSARLFKELELEDPPSSILRMLVPKFKELLELVNPPIQKKDTKFRQAVPTACKLLGVHIGWLAPARRSRECQRRVGSAKKLNMFNFRLWLVNTS